MFNRGREALVRRSDLIQVKGMKKGRRPKITLVEVIKRDLLIKKET